MYVDELVRQAKEKPYKYYMCFAGCGHGAIERFLYEPGGSKILIGAEVPYSIEALSKFLGYTPKSAACEKTSLDMAKRSYQIGCTLLKSQENIIGIGATGAIATDRLKKGDHRAFSAIFDGESYYTASIVFGKTISGRSIVGRNGEAVISENMVMNLLARYLNVNEDVDDYGFKTQMDSVQYGLISKTETPYIQTPDGMIAQVETLSPDKHIVYPGSFNPLHDGHNHLLVVAEEFSKKQVIHSIDTNHPEKGRIPEHELQKRLAQFAWKNPVLVTDGLSLYIEKARKFPGFTFLMGMDTLSGILNPKYCPIEPMLEEFMNLGTKFLVGRREVNGEDKTLRSALVGVNPKYHDMFTELQTKHMASSTAIRTGNQK